MANRWGNSLNSERLYLGGSQIPADGDCSHEIKRRLLLGRKVMTNLDSIVKSRDITLPTKVRLVKAMVFPMVIYECESWTIKKAECWRIDAFELWCWGRFLRVPWTARRSNQSILKDISPGRSLEGLMLKLKLQYFGHLMWRADSLEKILMLAKIEAGGEGDKRGWDGWMASPTQWTWVWVDFRSWWRTGRPGMLQFMGSQRVGHDWVTELNCTHFFAVFISSNHSYFQTEARARLALLVVLVPGGVAARTPGFYPGFRFKEPRGTKILLQDHSLLSLWDQLLTPSSAMTLAQASIIVCFKGYTLQHVRS